MPAESWFGGLRNRGFAGRRSDIDCPKCAGFIAQTCDGAATWDKCLNCGWCGNFRDRIAAAYKERLTQPTKVKVEIAPVLEVKAPRRRSPIFEKPETGCTRYGRDQRSDKKYYCGEERAPGSIHCERHRVLVKAANQRAELKRRAAVAQASTVSC